MPILIGGFGNFIVPLHLGTCEFAFPKINNFTFRLRFNKNSFGKVVYALLNTDFVFGLNYIFYRSDTYLAYKVGSILIEILGLQVLVYFVQKIKFFKNLRNQFKNII